MTMSPELPRTFGRPLLRRLGSLPSFVGRLDSLADREHYLGRARICARVAGMTPKQEDALYEAWGLQVRADSRTWLDLPLAAHGVPVDDELRQASGGWSWSVVAPNELTLAIRTRAFPSPELSMIDALQLLAHIDRLEYEPVGDPVTGHQGLWVVLDGRVVMVSGRTWRRPDASVQTALVRTLGRLRETRGFSTRNIIP